MIPFSCHVCRTPLTAEDGQAGALLRCPTCLTTLRVPQAAMATAGVGAATGMAAPAVTAAAVVAPRGGGRRYGFNCAYCGSRLEATEPMGGQDGQCPTCDNQITIPILDRYNRLIDPKTRKVIKQDPHPVHAYAAAGERAPAILRNEAGDRVIRCPRCSAISPIVANNCKSCGMPFTLEGTTSEPAGAANGFCTASLVLGIIGIPVFCACIPAVLAVIFGIIGYNRANSDGASRGKGMAIAGMICGGVGCLEFIYWISRM